MNRSLFFFGFTIYIAICGIIFLLKLPEGHDWFTQWIFDKFFVFQFVSVVTIGLAIEGSLFNNLTYVRIGNRRRIIIKELLGYYTVGFICLNIMFLFIIYGAFSLRESSFMLQLTDSYFKYLLGIILFINTMLCLKWSNSTILNRHHTLIVFIWMAIEIIVFKPYIKKFYGLDINLLFSWVFQKGTESYYWILGLIIFTALLNIRLSDKRNFI